MKRDTDPEALAQSTFAAFAGDRLIARGDLTRVVRAAHAHGDHALLVLEDLTGRVVDLDLRGSADEAAAKVAPDAEPAKPVRGRPRLGVTAREVTLLPRHWTWLATQPGGASATIRRLVDEARRHSGAADTMRLAQEATYRAMTILAGNLPGYEDAVRALYAGDFERLPGLTADWPPDIAAYVLGLAATARVAGKT
ncbi:DUF2239 family protein [Phenylobacterium sp.]|uniref:DUF2239 family protein n=1 Tax=Phenylobacterium sp. TaxID=1871053 RepID=UPI0012130FA0|nr:DUF2239 family protein [Phenylobacterium sp.]THD57515.1 MAG: DUF2239 family protein [Phenylobacterium sp.]